MKIRNGFVSNSSSSSFIVAFPKDILNNPDSFIISKLKRLLFDGKQSYHGHDLDYVSEIIMKEMKASGVFLSKKVCPHCGKELPWNNEEDYDSEEVNEIAEDFIKKYPDSDIFTFSFSDEDGGIWSDLEHGGVFENLNHEKINQH